MLVAFHRKHDFFARESFLEGSSRGRLGLVPLAVVLGSWMNVVGRWIAVDDLDGLIGDYAQHVGMILAPALVEGDGFLGNIEGAIAEALFNVDVNVGKLAGAGRNVLRHVGALASGILAHVNFGGLGSFAIEF